MANPAQIGGFIEELVHIITGQDKCANAAVARACKENASRQLKHHKFARTNQFAVRSCLEGLVERFAVLNNDISATELRKRVDELGAYRYQWQPEILSLLLQLCDKFVEDVGVRSLDSPRPSEQLPPLTWADIIAEEPLIDKELWEDVDFSRGFSDDDDEANDDRHNMTELTAYSESSFVSDRILATAEDFVIPLGKSVVQTLQFLEEQAHARRVGSNNVITVTELQILREVLHMLLGLPTRVFSVHRDCKMVPKVDFHLEHASEVPLREVLTCFATVGTNLALLRQFSSIEHDMPLLQTLTASITKIVCEIEEAVVSIDALLAEIKGMHCASLLEVQAQIACYESILQTTTTAITKMQHMPKERMFTILDHLYDEISVAQITGNEIHVRLLTKPFFNCLRTYLRTLIKWMTEGQLDSDNPLHPFRDTSSTDLSRFWQDRFTIVEIDGHLKAPRFLWNLLPRIFAGGKDVAFLRQLNCESDLAIEALDGQLPSKLDQLCEVHISTHDLPFSEVLHGKVQNLFSNEDSLIWNTLKKQILWKDGLWSIVEALERLYLRKDGPAFEAFASEVFANLDSGKSDWTDAYFLENALQRTIGHNTPRHVSANIVPRKSRTSGSVVGGMRGLSAIAFTYECPWSIRNIIPESTTAIYQRVCTLLLQIHRAKSLLCRQRLISRHRRQVFPSQHVPGPEHQGKAKVSRILHSTRHCLLWLITTLENYVVYSALATSTFEHRNSLLAADNMDDLISAHASYMVNLEKRCILSSATTTVHEAILSLLDLAAMFARLASQRVAETSATEVRSEKDESSLLTNNLEETQAGIQDHAEPKTESEWSAIPPQDYAMTAARLVQIQDQYSKLLGFAIAGLHAALRSSGSDPAWETLVGMLDWAREL